MTQLITPQNSFIDIWLLDISQFSPLLFSAAETMMSDAEQVRAQKLVRGKQEFIASRWLTRRVLADYTHSAPHELAFGHSPKGKPGLPNSGLHFSLSHSGHWAVLAVGKQEWLGVDIESCRPSRDLTGIAQSFFHPQEVQQLCALPEQEQTGYFYQLWTLKEAFFKALGSGISAGLEKIRFSPEDGNIRAEFSPALDTLGASGRPGDWQFYQTTIEPGVELALAYQAPQPLELRWFNPLAVFAAES